MTRLFELLFKIIMIPILFIREDIAGVSFKEKLTFLWYYIIIKTKNKRKIKLGDIKILHPILDKNHSENISDVKDFKIMFETLDTNPNWVPPYWSEEQKELKENILKGNYINGFEGNYIEISKDNILLNGHHRFSVLREKYGKDYKIIVKKSNLSWEVINKRGIMVAWSKVKHNKEDYKIINIDKAIQTWVSIKNPNIEMWTKEQCYLIIIIWNNAFPHNKIPIDE